MTTAQHAAEDTSARPVTLMARVPAPLAQEVHAYATTHHLAISTLVRAGLTYVLTQPPPVDVAVAQPPARPPKRPRLPWSHRVLAVLVQTPDGLAVIDVFFKLQPQLRRHHSMSGRAFIGGTLRALYRQGRIQRISHGVYAALPAPTGG